MVDIAKLWKYDLRRGGTDHPANGACLFDAGMWLVYNRIGDDPPCSCPIIRRYAIGLNDYFSTQERQLLKPFIVRVVGNRDPSAEAARIHFLVLETARRILPLILARHWPSHAAALSGLQDSSSQREIQLFCRTAARVACSGIHVVRSAADVSAAADAAADAAGYVSAAGYAAADAAAFVGAVEDTAADAADAAADAIGAAARAARDAEAEAAAVTRAAAYATYAATYATYAAANAARSTADAAVYAYAAADAADAHARKKIIDESIAILDGVLRIGKQAPEFDEVVVRAAVKSFGEARKRATESA